MEPVTISGPLHTWFCLVALSHGVRWWPRSPADGAASRGIEDEGTLDPRFAADLRSCLDGLAPLQRAVLSADLAAGGSVPARVLADRLKTTPNSVYVSRTLGRKALHAALQARGLGRLVLTAGAVAPSVSRAENSRELRA